MGFLTIILCYVKRHHVRDPLRVSLQLKSTLLFVLLNVSHYSKATRCHQHLANGDLGGTESYNGSDTVPCNLGDLGTETKEK